MGDISGGPAGCVTRRRRPRRYITYKSLDRMGAFLKPKTIFWQLFGPKTTIYQMVRTLHREREYHLESWLLYHARLDVVRAMLAAGARINVFKGEAMFRAIAEQNRLRARFLFEHGARIPRREVAGGENLKWALKVRKTAGGLLRDWRNS